jgi:hypothetical protein
MVKLKPAATKNYADRRVRLTGVYLAQLARATALTAAGDVAAATRILAAARALANKDATAADAEFQRIGRSQSPSLPRRRRRRRSGNRPRRAPPAAADRSSRGR